MPAESFSRHDCVLPTLVVPQRRRTPRSSQDGVIDLGLEALCHRLDELDDVVFAALTGCRSSLARARELWPAAVREVGGQVVEESRAHFLAHAEESLASIDQSCDSVANIEARVETALEVIALLTAE